jgi:biotin carboxyl carrier protein
MGRRRGDDVKYKVHVGDQDIELEIRHSGETTEVALGERTLKADLIHIPRSSVYSLILDGQSYEVSAHRHNGRFELVLRGEVYEADVMDERAMRIAEATGDVVQTRTGETILAPMPGVVVGIGVAVGDTVEPGQGVVTLEAMKMENELKCTVAGTVCKIMVECGKGVAQGQPLLVIE